MAAPEDSENAPANPGSGATANFVYRYKFANVEFDESTARLQVANAEVAAEPLPLNLLLELLRRPNEVVTRAELFEALWDGRPTVDHVLANAVNKLRKALGAEGAARLVNLPRVGYRLVGPVERSAVGRRRTLPLDLHAGDPVPGRDGLRLERPLGAHPNSAAWLTRDAKLQTACVFKFAADADRLAVLKREYTVYRVLQQELGERRDFARVLGANFSTAPYFLECEYGGPDLLNWAAEAGRLNAMPQPERIALFLQIARAVAAAHGVGVLHKDLKPANVLIGGEAGESGGAERGADGKGWVARLTDFGNSRLLQPGRLAELGVTAMGLTLTQGAASGAVSGTPLYLAPELLAGQSPSTRSDLYALGLMLYQLLVGDLRRPMSTGWQRDIADDLLRDDLTAATEGRPEDRLGSVAELVQRLAHLPQRRAAAKAAAEQTEAAARNAKHFERSRARRPWVTATIVSLALGLVAAVWFQHRAATSLLASQAASERERAINEFLTQDLLVSPELATTGAHKPVTMLEILRRGSRAASQRFKNQPLLEAAVRQHLGHTFRQISSTNEANLEFEAAERLLAPRVAANDPLFLSVRFEHAQLQFDMTDRVLAVKTFDAAEQAAGPAVFTARDELAVMATLVRVLVLLHRNQIDEAETAARQLVGMTDSMPNPDLGKRIDARGALAEVYQRKGNDAAAARVLAELLAPPFNADARSAIKYSRVEMLRATLQRDAGRWQDAERIVLGVIAALQRSPEPSEWHLGYAYSELGHAYSTGYQYDKAASSYAQAMALFRAALGEDHQFYRVTASNLAGAEGLRGHHAAALAICEAHAAWFKRHASRGYYPGLELARARALIGLDRPAEALPHLNNLAQAEAADAPAADDEFSAWSRAYRGIAQMRTGRAGEGRALLREAKAALMRAGKLPTHDAVLDRALDTVPR